MSGILVSEAVPSSPSFSNPAPLLPDDLQPKLNLPRVGGCSINRTCTPYRCSVLIEKRAVCNGRLEVGAVEDVEELRPKLRVEVLRNSPDVGVLEQREIK